MRHCVPADCLVAALEFTDHPTENLEQRRGMEMPSRNSNFIMSRRALLAGAAAAGVVPASRVLAQSSEPLRIGFLTVKTGPLAAGGAQQIEGANLFLKERDNTLAGRKVELVTKDTAGTRATAKTLTQGRVERREG